MPGTHELQLINRYFGGPTLRWARSMGEGAKEAMLAEQPTSSTGHLGKHVHHTHTKSVTQASKKERVTDEELMQVMFNKFKSTKYHGPALTEQGTAQPGH